MRLGRLLIGCLLSSGCAAPYAPIKLIATAPSHTIQLVRHEEAAPTPPATMPFAEQPELSADAVVEQVLARNPSLARMTAALHAAEARYPQTTALDDPMLGVQWAPGALGSDTVDGGYRIEVSQKLPGFGKRTLRGAGALAEAHAAGNDVEDMRLQLIESARLAFCDYYLADRALAVNREALRLLEQLREKAKDRYQRVKEANQQDIDQAEVEVGRQRERLLSLERSRTVAVARVNTLMHLPPDAPLPPPGKLRPPDALPDASALRQLALTQRPDLKALADRVAAAQSAVALACKEYCPDVEVMAAYDAIWQERPLRAQVGVRVNLPVRLERRRAAVDEAEARLAQSQAELARRTDEVNFQVEEAHAQVGESERIVRLYEGEVLRAAQKNVEAARDAYEKGKIPFVALLEAQRTLVGLQDRYQEALTEQARRRATLERAIGGSEVVR
jgi:outer membrane protein, heavy metal efflux system